MPHVIHLALGFPPAAKSSTYRLRATANLFAELGWDVTVVNLHERAWSRESGLDRTLLNGVHPNIEVVEIPHGRADLEPDIRTYSKFRARHPDEWLKRERRREHEIFPEPIFGSLRPALEETVLDIHRRKPADLVFASSMPHTVLAAAWRLWEEHRVPYVMEFRDAWTLSTFRGEEAFPDDSPEGQWERKLVEHALQLWTVNPQIQQWYQERYPEVADKIKCVRNGYDPMPQVARPRRDPRDGLRIGYLGTSSFPTGLIRMLLDAWHAARQIEPVIERSTLEFRGHFGIGAVRGMHPTLHLIRERAHDGVSFRGPVPREQVAHAYAEWDALLLILPGGRYVTSGKVYEYMATGLPIMSVHGPRHAADEVLEDYPLWVPAPDELTSALLLVSFVRTAQLALATEDADRARARRSAAKFARRAVMEDAIREVAQLAVDRPVSGASELLARVGKRVAVAPDTAADVVASWSQVRSVEHAVRDLGRRLPAIVRALRHARAASEAELVAAEALPMLIGESRALVALEEQTARLAQAKPARGLGEVVRDVLDYADDHLRSGRFGRVAEFVLHVNEAVFHRELHGEVERAPLAYEPEEFLAPLRQSLTYQALGAPAGSMADRIALARERSIAAPPALRDLLPADTARGRLARRLLGKPVPARDGRTHVLVLTSGNLHFTSGLLADLEKDGGFEIRVVNPREAKYPRRGHAEMIADRLAAAAGREPRPLPAHAQADLRWADIVFVDWFDVVAQWAAIHVPAGKRLVIRLHSIESVSAQPHLVDYTKVSDLIFVGGHVRDLFERAVPAVRAVERVHVLPNEMRLGRFGLPKLPAAERTIIQVGWGKMVKDPLWAVELLAELRAVDPTWRLLLAGGEFNASQTASGYAYRDAFGERIAHDDVREAVVLLGHRDDLPEVFREAGYVVSCSRRESFGVGLVEGAASAAVPIVRDWPMAKPYGGARRVFPDEWVVEDVAEAARRIRSLAGPARRRAGEQARTYALAHFDWSAVAPGYHAVFGAGSANR